MLQQERPGTSEFIGKGVIPVSMGKRDAAWLLLPRRKSLVSCGWQLLGGRAAAYSERW